ncbi:MAG: Coenzyme F420 hydrogenase/dehydrogenase, beta subunit C-terminal domain [Candidatus Omnitrophica bacterium]|nr:Coenzyme F420 hydrogenase/dehydrogenase, beta subunit C-terminal domain [Candidatus Omnitrophota bacterium]MDD5552963.1 Coenzyme F420 hydrogenase/dehydrogenase, beta subunit C-terminal domain [Candidatus Omnitrophota bacterium]
MITENLDVVDQLCAHCGVCSEVCPRQAIANNEDRYGFFLPRIDKNKCNGCLLCHKICPVEAFQFKERLKMLEKDRLSVMGKALGTYLGYHVDSERRSRSSSGGVVSGLLHSCLKSGRVSAALAVGENPSFPLKPVFRLFRTPESLKGLAASKYSPVFMEGALKQAAQDPSVDRMIFVGLPCHIRAVKKAKALIPALSQKEIITIGIFCKKSKDLRFTGYLLSRLTRNRNFSLPDVAFARYRGSGWPGETSMRVCGKEYRQDNRSCAIYSFPWKWHLFSPDSCLFCYDPFARDADISVGDPWLKKYTSGAENQPGLSFVIARTGQAREILVNCGELVTTQASPFEVLESQSPEEIRSKLQDAASRMRIVLKRRGSPLRTRSLMNAYWFLSLKRLFETIFENKDHVTGLPDIFFKVLTRLPTRIMGASYLL